jgi:hypothetical protein
MNYFIHHAGFPGLDIDLDFYELRGMKVALVVLEEFGRMVEGEVKKLVTAFGQVKDEDGELIFEREGENIETAIRLFLHKKGDIVGHSFVFNREVAVEDGHANGGLIRAFLEVTPKAIGDETEAPMKFEVMYDMNAESKTRLTLTLVAFPRNGVGE